MCSTSVNTDPTSGLQTTQAASEVARANLYLLMSRSFSSPLVMEESDPEQLRKVADDLPHTLQSAALALADAWKCALKDREALSLAYARLFLGPFEILSPPYASFYLEADQRLMGEVSQMTARMYAEAGLEPGHGPREAPDHAALEWEFMYFLTHQYLSTGEEQWIEQRRTFRSTHLDRWMPSLAAAIACTKEHEFYDALAVLLSALLEDPECR